MNFKLLFLSLMIAGSVSAMDTTSTSTSSSDDSSSSSSSSSTWDDAYGWTGSSYQKEESKDESFWDRFQR